MKPVACGNHVYSTGTLSSAATISAILFSNPSPLSFENGRLAGSAHTRSAVRLTRSTRCPSAARTGAARLMSSRTAASVAALLLTEARFLVRFSGGRLLVPFGRPPSRQYTVRTRFQVHIDVVDVAHDVVVIAEHRHHALLVGAHHLAAAGDDRHEVLVTHGLQR